MGRIWLRGYTFIDWKQDENFDGPNEVYNPGVSADLSLGANASVPIDAQAGNARLRVMNYLLTLYLNQSTFCWKSTIKYYF